MLIVCVIIYGTISIIYGTLSCMQFLITPGSTSHLCKSLHVHDLLFNRNAGGHSASLLENAA